MKLSEVSSEQQLDEVLARPYPETVEMMRRLDGDIIILGVGGKMGPTLARMAANACREAGVSSRVIGVARFSEPGVRESLAAADVEPIACDLLEPAAVARLPRAENVIFMAGRKFGSVGSEALTWMMNVVVPENVARVFRDSRIVAFSTGCVYPLVGAATGGSSEADAPAPVGEYANSCLGRERVFEHYAENHGTRVLLFRLNYAIDLRYGVLTDIAYKVMRGEPVDLGVSYANVIWQGDANNRALLSLEHAASPAMTLNVTGHEMISVRDVAEKFGHIFGKPVQFTGSDSGRAYLSDAKKSIELFGPPRVTLDEMIEGVASWLARGGRLLGKPTHFSVTDGQFLD
jgi:nucleoside-diphosphate-sugar epimerase